MADATPPRPEPEYSVDLSLIRWMLSLTPRQRLDFLQDHVNGILELRALNRREADDQLASNAVNR